MAEIVLLTVAGLWSLFLPVLYATLLSNFNLPIATALNFTNEKLF